jgi:hypothetical protein
MSYIADAKACFRETARKVKNGERVLDWRNGCVEHRLSIEEEGKLKT